MSRPTIEQFHAQALEDWRKADDIAVQTPEGAGLPLEQLVDVDEDGEGAWVMAWVHVDAADIS